MIYRYFIDNLLFDEPQGWDKFATDIKRDNTLNYIVVDKNLSLTFGVQGYNYFNSLIQQTSATGVSDILIENSLDGGLTWNTFHVGKIMHSDLKFNEKTKEVKVSVQDNSFYAYINNNLDVGAYLFAGRSKNNILINVPTQYTFTAFDISNVPYPANTTGGFEYQCYLVYDVFKYLIDFISDGKIQFQSNTFDIGGDYHDYFITTGFVLKYSILNGYNGAINPAGVDQVEFQESWKEISFKDFYTEMHKRFNLIHWIEYNNNVPTFRIEKEQTSRTSSVIALSNHYIDELEFEFDNDYLYSVIKCGQGAVTENASWLLFNDRLRILGFREEEFTLNYQSNLNKTLDLKSNYIHDHNTIMDCLDQGWGSAFGDTYNQDVFIFNATDTGGNTCSINMTNWINTAPPFYINETLNNSNILQRFQDLLPVTISQLFNPPSLVTADVIAVHDFTDQFPINILPVENEPVQFSIDTPPLGTDINNAWGNGTSTPVSTANSRYTAQYNGLHNIKFNLQTICFTPNSSGTSIGVRVYDATNVLQSQSGVLIQHNVAGVYEDDVWNLTPVFMNIGWYAQVVFATTSGSGEAIDWLGNTINKYNSIIINETQQVLPNNPNNFNPPYWKYKFRIPMNEDEMQLILNDLPSKIPFRRYGDSSTRYGWIKSLRYNHKENIASIELISQKQ